MLACLTVLAVTTSLAVSAHGRSAPPKGEGGEGTGDDVLAELERAYARGEERFHAGDLDGAVEAFSDGLSQIGPEGPRRLRAYFSVSLAIAHLDRYDATGERVDLERAHELLANVVEHDADTLRGEPRLEALARRNLERARVQRPTPLRAPDSVHNEPPPSEPRPSEPRPASVPKTTSEAPVAARHRAVGIGLLVSGTALVAGGVAVVIDGATLERRARAIAEDPPEGRQKAYIEDEVPRLARIRYSIAGPVLAVGVGLLVGGGILLHRAARPQRVVVAPFVTPRAASVALRARF